MCEVRDPREAEVAVPLGKVANMSFLTCHKMWSCRFAWQACHFVTFHMCEVRDPREAEVAVPMGKVAQTCHVDESRCAHVVLRDRHETL